MKFGHIALRTKNIERMLEFYCQKMGFKEAFRIYNDDKSLRIVYLHISDHQFIELCTGGLERPPFDDKTSLGLRHVCFTVDNLAGSKKELEKRGVVFDSDILIPRDNNPTAYLFDSDKNKIEIVQISPISPQHEFFQQK